MSQKPSQAARKARAVASSRCLCSVSFSAVVLCALLPSAAYAQDNQNWDANGTAVGNGGTGTWDTTDPRWSPNTDGVSGPYTVWDSATPDNAIFGGTAGTVTLGVPITVHNITFTANGYTLAGNTLTLGGVTPTVTTNASVGATINSILAGTAGLTKAGTGTLTLNGANSFSGTVNVTAGTLNLSGDAALGAAGNGVTLANGTTFTSVGALNASRTVTLSGGTAVLSGAGVGSARYTGAGGLNANVTVTLNNDANNYTGQTLFASGSGAHSFTSVADLGVASSLGAPVTVANGTISVASGGFSTTANYIGDGDSSNRNWSFGANTILINAGTGTLTLTGNIVGSFFNAQTADLSLLGVISGAAGFSGGGVGRTITLGTANSYSSATTAISNVTVRAGSLTNAGVVGSLGTGSSIALGGNAALSYTGAGDSSDRTWSINGANTLRNDGSGALALSGAVTFNAATPADSFTLGGSFAGINTLSGVISGAGGVTGNGSGTWVLGGVNTYAGTTTVDSGTLRAGTAQAFGASTNSAVVNGGTLDLGGFNTTVSSLAGTGGTVALGAGTLTLDNTAGTTSYAGSVTGSGGLTKLGASSQTLAGTNSYSGATTIGSGTLSLDFGAATAPTSDIVSGASVLNMGGGTLAAAGAAGEANTQTFNGVNVTGGSNRIVATSGAGGSMTLNLGAITRTGGLIDFSLPTSGNITTSNAVLGGWATVASGTNYAKVVGGNITAFTAADYTHKDNAATWLNNEFITDTAGFFGAVGSTVQLAGLRYTAPAATTVTVAGGQTLGVDGSILVAPTVGANTQTITGGSITGTSGGGVLGFQQNSTGNFIVASQIVDNGGSIGLTKAGTGLLTISNAANNYTGQTRVVEGTLSVASIGNGGVASGIGASSAASSNLALVGGTLRYTGTTAATDRGFTLVNASPSRTFEVSAAATNLTFTGLVTSPDDAGFIKSGLGTLTLANGANDYIGGTTVTGGTLAVGTLADGGLASGIGSSSSASGNLVLSGGTLSYTGGTASTNRGFTVGVIGAGGSTGGIGVSNAAATLSMSGTVIGDELFHKDGAGTLVLSGINSYSGGTIVNAGTLRAGSTQAFGNAASTLNVAAGATADLNNFNTSIGALLGAGSVALGSATLNSSTGTGTFSGSISGTGGLIRGGGFGVTQTMAGCNNSYAGATTITSGILTVDCLANGGLASGIGASTNAPSSLLFNTGILRYTGGSVSIDRGFTVQSGLGAIEVTNTATTLGFGGTVAGSGSVRKDGPGTLVLSGNNIYTGGTQVIGGTLRAGSATAFGTGGMTLDNTAGVALDLTGFSASVAWLAGGGTTGGNTNLGAQTLTISTGSNSYAGNISGTGNLIKNGGGIQTLSGCNSTYTGTTTVNGGALSVDCLVNGGSNSSIGASSSAAGNLVLNGGTLRYTGATTSSDRLFTLGTSGGTLDASGTGTLNLTGSAAVTLAGTNSARTFTLTGSNTGSNVFAGLLGNNGTGLTSLTKTGTGTWQLTNNSSNYTGITTISGGVLEVSQLADGGVASAIGASSGAAANLVISNGSTLRYTGAGDTTNRLFTLGTGVAFIESSGTGAINFSNTGAVTLSGTNTPRTIALGGTNTGNNTLGGAIGNNGTGVTTLAKNDSGTWILTGNNTYTGNTVVNNGNLVIGNGGTSGNAGAGNVIVDSATSTLSFNRSDTFNFTGTLSGPGSIAQIGAGTTVLTSASNNIGAATISAGTLQVNGTLTTPTIAMAGTSTLVVNGTVQAPGATPTAVSGDGGANTIVVNSGVTLRANLGLDGGNDLVNLAGTLDTGGVVLDLGTGDDTLFLRDGASLLGVGVDGGGDADTLQVDNALALTFDGASVANFETLLKQNSGVLTLTGAHSYSAGTTIAAGTLRIGNGGLSGTLAGNVANNAALEFNRAGTLTVTGQVSGAGSVSQLGPGTTVLTSANIYAGGTTIAAGTLQLGDGGATGSIVGNVANNGILAFNRNNAYTFGGTISGSGQVTQIGSGTTVLTGTNSYSGGTSITAGTLQVSSDANLGAAGGGLSFNGGTLRNAASMAATRAVTLTDAGTFLTDPDTMLTLNGPISGAGTLTKLGAGALTLTADNSYTGPTTIGAGMLRIGNGGATGSISGSVLNNGALVADRSGTLTLGGTIQGSGTFIQAGSGTTVLTGANSYAGATSVNAGTLLVNGDQSGAAGPTSVASGATLGGTGTIGGSVTIADGGTLAAGLGGVGTFTVNGELSLGNMAQLNFEFGQANAPGGPLNDLVNVGGDLTLDGTVNVTQAAGGTFGPGVYRMINYSGTLTDNGLTVGTLPSGTAFVQTVIADQVNLVNTAGLTLNFWDGAAGPKNDSLIQGGTGTWRVGGAENNWTEVNGAVNADYAQDSFAIFQGTGGTVTVDNSGGDVLSTGMQFTVDGYVITGNPLTLTGGQALVRTGDGSPTDSGITTTIDAAITGSAQLVKDLGGILALTGVNSYTGGTAINGGTLRISSDANLGDAAGGLSFNGGTLNTTALTTSGRTVDLAGTGTFLTDATLTLNGAVSGSGPLVKDGAAALILAADNSYTGGTTINGGALQIGAMGATGSILGDVVNNGRLIFNRATYQFDGTITGTGSVTQTGTATILTADSNYSGGTEIVGGLLQLGNGGTTGSITGDVVNNDRFAFNRSNEMTFAGLISGIGSVEQAGTGTTILTASNSYTGTTTVSAGTLLVNGNQSAATGATSVAPGATLGGIGTIGGNVTLAGGATLAPGQGGPGTLTINGNLSLASATTLAYDFGQSNVAGGPLNDLTEVGGNLTLDGTVNVTQTAGGSFGPGLYRVISYGGTLTDNGLVVGALPSGSLVSVQTSITGQVNLVNATGATLNFWDGSTATNEANSLVDGGGGTWQNSSGNNDWTTATGQVNGAYTDGAFAIFGAASGTVSVDNSLGTVTASGLQFASDGYTITGQDLTLVGLESTIRVGDVTTVGAGFTATIDAALVGAAQLVKSDLGTLVLTGTNGYTGGTRIDAGTLRIASDASLGDAAGGLGFKGGTLNTTADIGSNRLVTLAGNGSFATDAGTTLTLNGIVSGAGGLTKDGAGSLVLTGVNSYGGNTVVTAGSLFMNGDQSAATGLTSVALGATLGGSGIIGGNISLADGATLAAGTNNVGTLAINGNLALSTGTILDFEFGQANVAGGALNDLVNVGGDLTLDGTIKVSVPASGSFGPGIYRAFNYGGTLIDNGLTLGTQPGGSTVSVQTAVAGQVNLVNTAGLTLSFWDGTVGPKNNNAINGGNGVWHVGGGSSNWTDAGGALNADYAQGSFAIFSAAPGTVTVDNVGGAVLATGLQFASDGYTITGGPLTLTGGQATLQVGDGSSAGAGYTARIETELAGAAQLLKIDAGRLVLAGTNSYTGGTQIDAGTLQLGNGGNTGSIVGNVTNNGTLAFSRSDSYRFDGMISGSGMLAQLGTGTTVLAADNNYSGGTTIGAGTLQVGNGGTSGSLGIGDVLNNGALIFDRSNDLSFDGTISGAGTLTKLGAGTLTLTADNGYTGLTTVTAGTLQIGNGGATGGIVGDIVNNGTLIFNRTGNLVYAGAITGTGPVNLLGGGTYNFTGTNSYSGNTNVTASSLRLSGGGSITTTAMTTISGANGTVTVTGAESALTTNTLRVSIGNDNSALNIENGGLVRVTSTAATEIGAGTGGSTGTGILNVSGAGSLFDVAGALALGAPVPTVSAIVNVTGGGTILSDSGSIGYAVTGVNTPPVSVTVSGAGSNWTMANALNLRGGSMSILDGGLVSAGSAQIGFAASDVLVSGAGSSFSVTGDASIGTGTQTATVTLAKGGEMSVAGQLTLASAAESTTVLNIGSAFGSSAAGAGVLDAAALSFGPGSGTLVFNHTDTDYGFATALSGAGTINHSTGVTRLTGDSSAFTGQSSISGGTLLVNGTLGDAASVTNVLGGGTLGGLGTVGGNAFVADGATLAPGSNGVGALTIDGDLGFSPNALLAFEFGQANVPGGPLNDLVNVGGDLTLDGTINVSQPAGGSFGPGVYRVINYAGTLTDNGLAIGSLPGGTAFVQTAVANQVNLVNTAGLTLNFWDGAAGPKNDGAIQGGDGTWVLGSGANDWTEVNGRVNADYAQGSIAIFQGTGGTVTVDNSAGNIRAAGMQFTADGYTVAGGPLALTGTQAFVRVGDGGAGDAGLTATINAALTGSAQLTKDMGGTLVLTGANSYSGGTAIDGGTLQLGNGGTTGSVTGNIVNNGGLVSNRSDILSLDGTISGSGSLTQAGSGLLILTANDDYTGGTTIARGSLSVGNGGTTGSIVGDVINNGNLGFARSDRLTFTGVVSGSGSVTQQAQGTTILTGTNSYAGETRIAAGTLLINGDQSAATGVTNVLGNAALGGTGIIGGDVVVANGGTLAAGAGGAGVLTINGDLALGSSARLAYDFGAANAVGNPLNDLINVGSDLSLDGTIDVAVTPGGAFDIGLYRIANYGGTLTDNGLAIGAIPAGADVFVQTAVANQVNLINVGGAVLNFWDGAAGPKFNGVVNGGEGVWQSGIGNDNWADATGAVNAPFDDGAFAIFTGTAGAVTIDNSLGTVTASGLQFAVDGYTITGNALTLTGPQSVIRVGDGTAAGAGYTATIGSDLTGATQLVKTDVGTLVLTGINSYTGGTAINGGTVRITSDANLGAAAGALNLNGGTLGTAADMISARAIQLAGTGTFLTDAGTTLTLSGAVSGAGSLTKSGTGTLTLSGTGTHVGATNVGAGTLLINGNYAGATGAVTVASGASLGGTGAIGGDVALADGAILTPGAGGAGTLAIGGDLVLFGGTQLAYEFGQAGTVGGALNDLVTIGGDLTLDGMINVTVPATGAFDAGIYRIFNYGGTLTDSGLTLGTMPGGSNVAVQTSIAGQVNLVNSAGLPFAFWDGAAGPKNNGVIDGGNGIWQNSSGNDNWTNASGTVNAAYSDGAFAAFGGTGSTITVDNSVGQVTVAGMQFAANGYTISGNAVALTGPQSTIRVGDGTTAGAGFTATINSVLSGDTQLVKTDAGTLVLGGSNSYTGGTRVSGGIVQISADANLGAAGGDVTLDGGTLATSADMTSARDIVMANAGTIQAASGTMFTFNGLLSGSGALNKTGSGTLLLTGNSSGFTGSTRVEGTLTVNGSLCGDMNVLAGARLGGTGTVCTIVNSGTVAPGNSIGTLTVAGSYTGSGGTLEIEAELGGDASPTDRLVVTNGTSGTTRVDVINRGGLGAQTVEGIKIVDVTGGTSAGTFALNGDYDFQGSAAVIAGAYGYRLYQGGTSTPTDGDWYLRSALLNAAGEPQAPLYQPGVPVYEAYGQTLFALTDMGTLQQRIGNRQWAETEGGKPSGIWGRMQSNRSRQNAVASTSLSDVNVDSWKIEMGADHVLSERSDGASLVLGVLGSYGDASASIASIYGNGSIETKGYSAGTTLTWFGPQGLYVDGRAQVTWFDSKLKSAVLGTLADDNKGVGQAYSLEVGKRSPIGRTLAVTPQIQVVYSKVKFDRFTDPNDAMVSSDRGDSLKTRWGISIDRQDAKSHLYGVANLSYEWLDGTVTDVSGTPIARQNHRLWGELGIGGSLLIGDRLTLYTEASANAAINDFAKSYSLKGTAGLRLSF